ncbi:ATP-binding protein [Lachnospiraceae bacterium JLR.KK008]
MPLTNQQYDSIFREFEEKQNRSQRKRLQKLTEIYENIPEYEEVEHSISSVSVAQAKKLLDGDDHALADLKHKLQTLSQKKHMLLRNAGYPETYLDPEYECTLCKDTGYIEGQKCNCLKQKIVSLLYEQSNIKETLEKENFSVLSYDYYEKEDLERFRQTVSASNKFICNFSSAYRNLFFYGSVGAGKSFLSNCIAKELIEAGYLVLYFSASGLIDTLSGNSFAGRARESLYHISQDLYHCDLLIIDDLGTEYTNAYVVSQLFSCLNERHLRRKSTLISTNLSLEDLRNKYSERIFSRITSNYDMYKVTGPDIRMYRKTMMNRK